MRRPPPYRVTAYPYTWAPLLVDALACYRLTRLVTADVITSRPRRALIRWAYRRAGADLVDGDVEAQVEADMGDDPDGTPRLAVLIVCRWCTAVWCAAGVVAARCVWPAGWAPVAALLAVASVGTLVAGLERD